MAQWPATGFTIGAMSDYDELRDDPCRSGDTFSGPRFLAFALLFAGMFTGAIVAMFSDSFYATLLASILGYTACVMLYGFARNKNGIQPYLFTCPVVMNQSSRLLKRHAIFLAVLIAFEIIAHGIKLHLSSWWLTASGRNMPPFLVVVFLPVAVLALTEIMTNRGVLERAHNDRFGEPPGPDQSGRDAPISLFGRDQ
jgi:hypothetical protein